MYMIVDTGVIVCYRVV